MDREIWIWGRRPVLEALRAGRAQSILLSSGRADSAVIEEMRALAQQRDVPIRTVGMEQVERVSGSNASQGVAALIRVPQTTELNTILNAVDSIGPAFLLCLDRLQDPHNLGALVRTANAVGVHAVILPDRHSAPLSGAVVKASAGATFYTTMLRVPNLAHALGVMRTVGIWTVGLDAAAETSIFELDLTSPIALVIGGEGEGLRRLTRVHCDYLAGIPMIGAIDSLNAAIAGSVAMYEVVRQRLRFTANDESSESPRQKRPVQ